jgi:hypothetical protein
MKPCFLLDEHINRAVQRQLRRLLPSIDVLAIGDPGAPSSGTTDAEILHWLEEHGYILVTKNRSTMPNHISDHFAAGGHFPGVFWLRPGISIGKAVEELHLIWLTCEAEEFRNCTLFIPL